MHFNSFLLVAGSLTACILCFWTYTIIILVRSTPQYVFLLQCYCVAANLILRYLAEGTSICVALIWLSSCWSFLARIRLPLAHEIIHNHRARSVSSLLFTEEWKGSVVLPDPGPMPQRPAGILGHLGRVLVVAFHLRVDQRRELKRPALHRWHHHHCKRVW